MSVDPSTPFRLQLRVLRGEPALVPTPWKPQTNPADQGAYGSVYPPWTTGFRGPTRHDSEAEIRHSGRESRNPVPGMAETHRVVAKRLVDMTPKGSNISAQGNALGHQLPHGIICAFHSLSLRERAGERGKFKSSDCAAWQYKSEMTRLHR